MKMKGSQQSRDREGAVRKHLVIGTSGNQVVGYQELGYLDI